MAFKLSDDGEDLMFNGTFTLAPTPQITGHYEDGGTVTLSISDGSSMVMPMYQGPPPEPTVSEFNYLTATNELQVVMSDGTIHTVPFEEVNLR